MPHTAKWGHMSIPEPITGKGEWDYPFDHHSFPQGRVRFTSSRYLTVCILDMG